MAVVSGDPLVRRVARKFRLALPVRRVVVAHLGVVCSVESIFAEPPTTVAIAVLSNSGSSLGRVYKLVRSAVFLLFKWNLFHLPVKLVASFPFLAGVAPPWKNLAETLTGDRSTQGIAR